MRRMGGTFAALAVLAASATNVVAPSAAATTAPSTAFLINANGAFYSLDTTSMVVSSVGTSTPDSWGLAAANDGQLYDLAGTSTQSLYRIDRANGAATLVGVLDTAQSANDYYGALGTPSNGQLYTEFNAPASAPPTQLASVSRTTGAATPIGAANDAQLVTMAGGCGGRLYGVNAANALVTVNLTNGTTTVVGQISSGSGSLDVGEVPSSLAVDHGTGVMWLLTMQSNGIKRLWRVNPKTAALTATSYVDGQSGASPVSIAFDSPARCQYARKVTLGYSKLHQRFYGWLSSSFPSCVARQTVVVYRKRSGPDAKVGTAITGSRGGYRLPKAFRHGTFYAVAPRALASGICLRTVSATLIL